MLYCPTTPINDVKHGHLETTSQTRASVNKHPPEAESPISRLACSHNHDAFQYFDSRRGSHSHCGRDLDFTCMSSARLHFIPHSTSCTVSQSQATPPKTHRTHLLPRRPELDPPVPRLRLPPHRRGHPSIHSTMGANAYLDPYRKRPHPAPTHRGCSQAHHRATRSFRSRSCRRTDMVAVATGRPRAESRLDRHEKSI